MASKRYRVISYGASTDWVRAFGRLCESVGRYEERNRSVPAPNEKYNPLELDDLLGAHREMFGTSSLDAGAIRTQDARILKGAQVSYVPPPPLQIPSLLGDLFDWLYETNEHLLVAAGIFHYQLLAIHPFADGNGRLARLWQRLILASWRPVLAGIDAEAVVKSNYAEYLHFLGLADRQKDVAPFLEFLFSTLESEIVRLLEKTSVSARAASPARPSDFVERLLAAFGNKTLTGAELLDALGMSHRGTFRKNYLDPALAAEYVEMTQPDSPRSPTQKYRLTQLGREVIKKYKR